MQRPGICTMTDALLIFDAKNLRGLKTLVERSNGSNRIGLFKNMTTAALLRSIIL